MVGGGRPALSSSLSVPSGHALPNRLHLSLRMGAPQGTLPHVLPSLMQGCAVRTEPCRSVPPPHGKVGRAGGGACGGYAWGDPSFSFRPLRGRWRRPRAGDGGGASGAVIEAAPLPSGAWRLLRDSPLRGENSERRLLCPKYEIRAVPHAGVRRAYGTLSFCSSPSCRGAPCGYRNPVVLFLPLRGRWRRPRAGDGGGACGAAIEAPPSPPEPGGSCGTPP